jgi:hypothetical protein
MKIFCPFFVLATVLATLSKIWATFPKRWVTQIDAKVSTKDIVGQIVFDQMTLNILIRLCPEPNVIKHFGFVIYGKMSDFKIS